VCHSVSSFTFPDEAKVNGVSSIFSEAQHFRTFIEGSKNSKVEKNQDI